MTWGNAPDPNMPKKPHEPRDWDYREKVEKQYIYAAKESLRDDDWEGDDEPEEDPLEKFYIKPDHEVTLAWLLTQVPKGVTPDQIKMEFGYNASSMAYEDHYVRFYYDVTIPADPKGYEKAMAQYRLDLDQYEKDMRSYQEGKDDEEIKNTEKRLKELKSKKKKKSDD